jgi:antitoxin component HigA of HigAB toxin-antitoxin module
VYGFQLTVRGGSYAGADMNKAFDDFYAAILELVDDLVELDPEPSSAEGKMLQTLAAAVEEYEKKVYPI